MWMSFMKCHTFPYEVGSGNLERIYVLINWNDQLGYYIYIGLLIIKVEV